jgi:hypothetical protein
MAPKVYDYDVTATTTIVYDETTVFTNARASLCPLDSCTLTQSDCVTALVAPFDTLLSIDTVDPWSLRVSQTQGIGYPDVAVCYTCKNKDSISNFIVQTLTN